MPNSSTHSLSLLETPFITTTDGILSLRQVFSENPASLAGDAQSRIIAMKLFAAVSQSALTLKTDADVRAVTNASLAKAALHYLDAWSDQFDLDAEEQAFLQFPEAADVKPFPGLSCLPGFLQGTNTPCLRLCSLPDRAMTDAERIWSVLFAVFMPTAGKKWKKAQILTPAAADEPPRKCTPAGAVGFGGYLHAFIEGRTILDTIRLNLLCEEDLQGIDQYRCGIGRAPWEDMQVFRSNARQGVYRHTLMGRLVPMARFVWLESQLHAALGIDALPLSEGAADPSVLMWSAGKEEAAYRSVSCGYSDNGSHLSEHDWRLALRTAGYINEKGAVSLQGPKTLLAQKCLPRAKDDSGFYGIWAGGHSLTYKSGEQVLTHKDVERSITLRYQSDEDVLAKGKALDTAVFRLHFALTGYFEGLGMNPDLAKAKTNKTAQSLAPDLSRLAQRFFEQKGEHAEREFARIAELLSEAYDSATAPATGRGYGAWSRNRPYFSKLFPAQDEGES